MTKEKINEINKIRLELRERHKRINELSLECDHKYEDGTFAQNEFNCMICKAWLVINDE